MFSLVGWCHLGQVTATSVSQFRAAGAAGNLLAFNLSVAHCCHRLAIFLWVTHKAGGSWEDGRQRWTQPRSEWLLGYQQCLPQDQSPWFASSSWEVQRCPPSPRQPCYGLHFSHHLTGHYLFSLVLLFTLSLGSLVTSKADGQNCVFTMLVTVRHLDKNICAYLSKSGRGY